MQLRPVVEVVNGLIHRYEVGDEINLVNAGILVVTRPTTILVANPLAAPDDPSAAQSRTAQIAFYPLFQVVRWYLEKYEEPVEDDGKAHQSGPRLVTE